ncbi:aspartyl-phosphate phosphatase Spo0E family protein [Brevibacillus laterosporus]|uniref:aspartyl-phosphate phosphatase Spo0E family protein n=1 Tax=Brevibacillus laterosporus TaxID=1465 RepID=UPI0023AA18EE|nr:aspartyl-phosphate phosphatase Spo0E family protein [Brevibacillus laterosporus]
MSNPHSKGTPACNSLHHVTTTLQQNDNDLQTTEVLRNKLVEVFFQEGSFSSPAVLRISQELDEYIVAIQKRANFTKEVRRYESNLG